MCNINRIMNTLINLTIVFCIFVPAWVFTQECPPADTIAVNPTQNIWTITCAVENTDTTMIVHVHKYIVSSCES